MMFFVGWCSLWENQVVDQPRLLVKDLKNDITSTSDVAFRDRTSKEGKSQPTVPSFQLSSS